MARGIRRITVTCRDVPGFMGWKIYGLEKRLNFPSVVVQDGALGDQGFCPMSREEHQLPQRCRSLARKSRAQN
jgi:hypothetical protein